MNDPRLVSARILVWNKDAWRNPAFLHLTIRMLEQIVNSDVESPESQAEAKMLIKQLYLAGKTPKLA
jgi:hypothetical protein